MGRQLDVAPSDLVDERGRHGRHLMIHELFRLKYFLWKLLFRLHADTAAEAYCVVRGGIIEGRRLQVALQYKRPRRGTERASRRRGGRPGRCPILSLMISMLLMVLL